jgi:hypothetical protein
MHDMPWTILIVLVIIAMVSSSWVAFAMAGASERAA